MTTRVEANCRVKFGSGLLFLFSQTHNHICASIAAVDDTDVNCGTI